MSINYDPVEETEAYKEAMKEIQPILDEMFPRQFIGMCHLYWPQKQQFLKERGVDWKTPIEMNPGVLFD